MNTAKTTIRYAVLYAVKSTEDTRGSIGTQLEDGRKLAAQLSLEVLPGCEYQDESASGYHGDRGPGLAEAMAMCERLRAKYGPGSVALIVQHSDRLARGDAKEARHLIEIVLWAIKKEIELLSVQDPSMLGAGEEALLMGAIAGTRANQDSARKSDSIKDGNDRRIARGFKPSGQVCFGWQKAKGPDVIPTPKPGEDKVVIRQFREYTEQSRSQTTIARACNAEGLRTREGALWTQSAVRMVLSNPFHMGKIRVNGEIYEAQHGPLISEEQWYKAKRIREAQRITAGRRTESKHMLVKGVFRCKCGSAMMREKVKQRRRADRYACSGRHFHGPDFCDQPTILRESVDEALLETLLSDYIDLDGMRRRVEQAETAALTETREVLAERQMDCAKIERAKDVTDRDYTDGKLKAEHYSKRMDKLEGELAVKQATCEQTESRLHEIEEAGVGDAEQTLLEYLATLKRAATNGAGKAPDLDSLRRVIRLIFRSIELLPITPGKIRFPSEAGDLPNGDQPDPVVQDGEQRYLLMLHMHREFTRDWEPIKQTLPVPPTVPASGPTKDHMRGPSAPSGRSARYSEIDVLSKEGQSIKNGASSEDLSRAIFGPVEVIG